LIYPLFWNEVLDYSDSLGISLINLLKKKLQLKLANYPIAKKRSCMKNKMISTIISIFAIGSDISKLLCIFTNPENGSHS